MVSEPSRAGACVFCDIAARSLPASIVHSDERTIAFMDLRQVNAGHVLVVPRAHVNDVRDLGDEDGAALMRTVGRIARAVGAAFPNEGLSVWHSIGPAAFQEVPHLHFHVHPRLHGDAVLRVYASEPVNADRATLERYAADLRSELQRQG